MGQYRLYRHRYFRGGNSGLQRLETVCIGAKDARNSAETILTDQNGILRLNGQQMGFRCKAVAKIDRMAYG